MELLDLRLLPLLSCAGDAVCIQSQHCYDPGNTTVVLGFDLWLSICSDVSQT